MILYPTDTLYALGVHALDPEELAKLYLLKERQTNKVVTWLLPSVDDIELYAVMPEKAKKIAEAFLPGKLTLILKAHNHLSDAVVAEDRTVGFRVSADYKAQETVEAFFKEHTAPLTCTSANISGAPTFSMPQEILQQFGEKASMIDEIVDDGPRKGLASTIVRVVGDDVRVLREGEISELDIQKCISESIKN